MKVLVLICTLLVATVVLSQSESDSGSASSDDDCVTIFNQEFRESLWVPTSQQCLVLDTCRFYGTVLHSLGSVDSIQVKNCLFSNESEVWINGTSAKPRNLQIYSNTFQSGALLIFSEFTTVNGEEISVEGNHFAIDSHDSLPRVNLSHTLRGGRLPMLDLLSTSVIDDPYPAPYYPATVTHFDPPQWFTSIIFSGVHFLGISSEGRPTPTLLFSNNSFSAFLGSRKTATEQPTWTSFIMGSICSSTSEWCTPDWLSVSQQSHGYQSEPLLTAEQAIPMEHVREGYLEFSSNNFSIQHQDCSSSAIFYIPPGGGWVIPKINLTSNTFKTWAESTGEALCLDHQHQTKSSIFTFGTPFWPHNVQGRGYSQLRLAGSESLFLFEKNTVTTDLSAHSAASSVVLWLNYASLTVVPGSSFRLSNNTVSLNSRQETYVFKLNFFPSQAILQCLAPPTSFHFTYWYMAPIESFLSLQGTDAVFSIDETVAELISLEADTQQPRGAGGLVYITGIQSYAPVAPYGPLLTANHIGVYVRDGARFFVSDNTVQAFLQGIPQSGRNHSQGVLLNVISANIIVFNESSFATFNNFVRASCSSSSLADKESSLVFDTSYSTCGVYATSGIQMFSFWNSSITLGNNDTAIVTGGKVNYYWYAINTGEWRGYDIQKHWPSKYGIKGILSMVNNFSSIVVSPSNVYVLSSQGALSRRKTYDAGLNDILALFSARFGSRSALQISPDGEVEQSYGAAILNGYILPYASPGEPRWFDLWMFTSVFAWFGIGVPPLQTCSSQLNCHKAFQDETGRSTAGNLSSFSSSEWVIESTSVETVRTVGLYHEQSYLLVGENSRLELMSGPNLTLVVTALNSGIAVGMMTYCRWCFESNYYSFYYLENGGTMAVASGDFCTWSISSSSSTSRSGPARYAVGWLIDGDVKLGKTALIAREGSGTFFLMAGEETQVSVNTIYHRSNSRTLEQQQQGVAFFFRQCYLQVESFVLGGSGNSPSTVVFKSLEAQGSDVEGGAVVALPKKRILRSVLRPDVVFSSLRAQIASSFSISSMRTNGILLQFGGEYPAFSPSNFPGSGTWIVQGSISIFNNQEIDSAWQSEEASNNAMTSFVLADSGATVTLTNQGQLLLWSNTVSRHAPLLGCNGGQLVVETLSTVILAENASPPPLLTDFGGSSPPGFNLQNNTWISILSNMILAPLAANDSDATQDALLDQQVATSVSINNLEAFEPHSHILLRCNWLAKLEYGPNQSDVPRPILHAPSVNEYVTLNASNRGLSYLQVEDCSLSCTGRMSARYCHWRTSKTIYPISLQHDHHLVNTAAAVYYLSGIAAQGSPFTTMNFTSCVCGCQTASSYSESLCIPKPPTLAGQSSSHQVQPWWNAPTEDLQQLVFSPEPQPPSNDMSSGGDLASSSASSEHLGPSAAGLSSGEKLLLIIASMVVLFVISALALGVVLRTRKADREHEAAMSALDTSLHESLLAENDDYLESSRKNVSHRKVRDAQEVEEAVMVAQIPVLEESQLCDWTTKPTAVNFRRGKMIGAGGFGRVYIGLDELSGRLLAAKEISFRDDPDPEKKATAVAREVKLMKKLTHQHVVQYLGADRDGETEFLIFMEYLPGGSLRSIISSYGKLSPLITSAYIEQALKGLAFLHEQEIVHRDIKAANLLLDRDGVLKISDLGEAQSFESVRSMRGTPFWMAPEVIRNEPVGSPSDIWSLGCTVMEMMTGGMPFDWLGAAFAVMHAIASMTENEDTTSSPSERGSIWEKAPPEVLDHETAFDFVFQCCRRDPGKRATAAELLDHPFVSLHKDDHDEESAEDGSPRRVSSSKTAFSSRATSSAPTSGVNTLNKTIEEVTGGHDSSMLSGLPVSSTGTATGDLPFGEGTLLAGDPFQGGTLLTGTSVNLTGRTSGKSSLKEQIKLLHEGLLTEGEDTRQVTFDEQE